MLWPRFAVFALFALSRQAQAQTVPPAPTPPPDAVVEEQHDIQVGDVIMAPLIEDAEAERQPGRERPPPRREPRHWYGAPILLADGVAYGSIALAGNVESTSGVALPIGVGTFVLAGPIVHAAHRRWGRMGLSLAARIALPFSGLLTGASGCGGGGDCSASLIGFTVAGMLAASILDASVLAYEPIAPPAPTSATVQPTLSVSQERLWLGASGTF